MGSGPARPVGMVMPAFEQAVFTYANIGVLLIVSFVAFRYARASRSAVPVALLAGGGLAVLFEPIVDVLGLCHFPEVGSWPLLRSFGVTVPLYTLPTFAWYVGGQALICLMALDRGLGRYGLVKLWVCFAVVNALLEIPGIKLGVFTYYGPQPLQVMGFPLWWSFCNALGPILSAAAVHTFRNAFVGWRAVFAVLIVPMAHATANAAVGWPVWLALNSGYGRELTSPAALVALGFAGLALFLVSQLVTTEAAQTHRHIPV